MEIQKTMNFKNLTIEKKQNNIWVLTVQRPAALNALNVETLTELENFLNEFSELGFNEARVLVITGAGEKAFVAGADIKEMSELNDVQAARFSEKGQAVFRMIENLKVPVIAAVNGFALGGGLELALACDFIYASENAKFALPEVSLGLIPGFGGTVRLSRVVGLNRSREMTMTGEMITAVDALAYGLVNRIFPLSELMTAVLKIAEVLSSRGPIAIAKAKYMVLESNDLGIDAGMGLESSSFGNLFNYKDTQEGLNAFIEKRKPTFVGY